jgi:hypothetical protein
MAAVSEYNADVARRAAVQEEKRGDVRAAQFKKKGEAIQATQLTDYLKAGVGVTGSPEVVMTETAKNLELDRQMLLHESATRAQELRSQATGHELQAESFKKRGTSQLIGAGLAAGGGALADLGAIKYRKSVMDYMGA